MNRVTIVNLAGRAWHVEDEGADAVATWLRDARARLATDPDVDELMLDFERAIADRCESAAPDVRDVITTAQAREMLAALGAVEPVETEHAPPPGTNAADAPTTRLPGSQDSSPPQGPPPPPRRLHRLTGDDESMIGGVCSGIAAYFNVDVTVVRVLTVLLALITSGAVLVAYIVMWVLVPEAVTPEQRAEARGAGVTAEEMLARARASASPSLTRAGSLLGRTAVVLGIVVRTVLLVAVLAVLIAWVFSIGALYIDGDIAMDLFDPGTSTWVVALWISCLAWVPIALMLLVERGIVALLPRRSEAAAGSRRRSSSPAIAVVLAATFLLAGLGATAIPAATSEQLRDAADGHGTLVVDGHTLCFGMEDAPASERARCDTIMDGDDD